MQKPPMPGMTDTLEFVKNLWGGMQIPGAVPGIPAIPGAGLSVEELDKKITDLKAVESWLNLNVGMLHGSIQALEIQRGTLVTLKAMGEGMAKAMGQTGAAGESAMAPFAQFFAQAAQAGAPAAPPPAPDAAQADATAAAMPAAVAWWNLLQDQFRQAVVSALPADGGAPDTPAGAPAPEQADDAPAAGRRAPRGKPDKA